MSDITAPGLVSDSLPADATAEINNDALSSATKRVVNALPQDLFGEDQSSATKVAAFGSPHVTSPLPASPLDAAAKQLDFDIGAPTAAVPASPSTPGLNATPTAAAPVPVTPPAAVPAPSVPAPLPVGDNSEGVVDYDTFVKETLLWVHKVRSVVYLLGGLLLIYVAHRLLSSDVTLLTGVCWALLAQTALNFLRAFISPKLQARCTWQDSGLLSASVNKLSSTIKGAAVLHDKHLIALDASKTLRIVLVLWGISLAGKIVGATGLVAALWVIAFVVPKLYTVFQTKVDTAVSDVTSIVKGRFAKLDPKARAALVVVPMFAAGYTLSSTDLAIATLALALYGRSWLSPSQVDRLNAVVAPAITNTVSKVGGTVSHVVQSAVTKYELTPTPSKVKRT